MRIVAAFDMLLRAFVLVVLSSSAALLLPTPDPFLLTVTWVLFIGVLLAVPPTRRFLLRWIRTGRVKARPEVKA
jgi:hypothetical protein